MVDVDMAAPIIPTTRRLANNANHRAVKQNRVESASLTIAHRNWYQNCHAAGNAVVQYGNKYKTVNVAGDLIIRTNYWLKILYKADKYAERTGHVRIGAALRTTSRKPNQPPPPPSSINQVDEKLFRDLFATCVAHFEFIIRNRSGNPVHRFVETRLNNLEARFTAWGKAVGLDQDSHSNNASVRISFEPNVADTLTCMIALFQEPDSYGLKPSGQSAESRKPDKWWPFRHPLGSASTDLSALGSVTRSEIHDVDKFSKLIKQLKGLIEDLEIFTRDPAILRRQYDFVADGLDSLSDTEILEDIENARIDENDTVSDIASIRLRQVRAGVDPEQQSSSGKSKQESFYTALTRQSALARVSTSQSLTI
ncbi:hypothetical protein B7463_g6895, partial [Scytalidium lignicola]